MKRKVSRGISLAMAAVMLTMTGCGDSASTGTATDAQEAVVEEKATTEVAEAVEAEPEEAEEKDYSEHYTYSYASTQITESTDYNSKDDAMTQYWQQKYNFDWDIISISADNWDSTVNTWAYSEDLPDITIFDYKHPQMMDWVDQGLVFEFPDGWEERWPNVAKVQEYGGIEPTVQELTGHTYFLARANYATHLPCTPGINPTNMMVYIRKDWAEAVGVEIKDYYTVDEIMEYARLVKEKDPGNIGKDLVPMGLSSTNCYNVFVSSESTYTSNNYYLYRDDNNDFHWGLADEETLEGLKLWRQAFDEGLLNKEFYSYSGAEDVEDFYVRGVSGLMWYQGGARYQQDVKNRMRDNLGLEYDDTVHQCFIISNNGDYHSAPRGNFWGVIMFNPDIEIEKWERYMDMLDESCSEEGQILIRMGFEGVDWEYQNGEMVSLLEDGKDARSKYPSIYPVYHQLCMLSDDFVLINPNYPKEFRDKTIKMYELKEKLGKNGTCPPIDYDIYLYSSDATAALSFEYEKDFANIVVNQGDVEKEWRDWLDSWAYLMDPVLKELKENIK